MTRSMTGFSSISGSLNLINFLIQIKSENSKSLDISIVDYNNNFKLQERIKQIIKGHLKRGKVRILINTTNQKALIKSKYIEKSLSQLVNIAKKNNLTPSISLLELKEIVNTESVNLQSNQKVERYQISLIKKAINQLIKNQKEEGGKMLIDINKKIENISKSLDKIKNKIAKITKKMDKKYNAEFSKIAVTDDSYIKKEIATLIERIDIEEEILRLESHINKLRKIARSSGSKGLIIDFYMQEINREANTLSSKSKDFAISDYSIEIKKNVNQVREIAANLD